jgi:hypothetical protein
MEVMENPLIIEVSSALFEKVEASSSSGGANSLT